MALINFLFGNRDPSGFTLQGVVEFDADLTISEQHERSSVVTDHPVESGANVSDHVIVQPERVILRGFVTDSTAAVFAADEGTGGEPGRTQDAFDVLDQLAASREPMDVVTGRKEYSSMVITRLDLPRERPNSMQFTIELQQVKIVDSADGTLLAAVADAAIGETGDAATQDRVAGEVNRGRQQAREASESTQQEANRVKSTAAEIFDFGRGLF